MQIIYVQNRILQILQLNNNIENCNKGGSLMLKMINQWNEV